MEPLIELTDEIENSISFSQYLIKDDVLAKLKKQQEIVKDEIIKAKMQLTRFSHDDKVKALNIAEDGIKCFVAEVTPEELSALREKLREYRNALKDLENSNDVEKIKAVSKQITKLYKSACEVSDFVKEDFDKTKEKFHINYIKNRNSLQTMTFDEKEEEIFLEQEAMHDIH